MSTASLFPSEKVPSGVLAAKVVGLTSAALLTGMNGFVSIGVVPAIMQAPAGLAASQWKTFFKVGAKVGPALAVLGSLSTSYLAWREPRSSSSFKLWVASAVSGISIIPLTFAAIKPINDKLFAASESLSSAELNKDAEVGVAKAETVHALLDKWATLNLVRALLTGVAAVSASLAAC